MKKNLLCYFPQPKTGIKRFLLTINLALIVACLSLLQVSAIGVADLQQLQVSGKVTDSNTREPLIGATVVIKGTNIGVTTSADGTYTINVPEGSDILVFSYIGYTTQEVNVSGRTTLDVALVPEVTGLEEVVVTGYGTQKKETLTGSIATVGGNEIAKSPQPNVTNSLTGKLPGLMVNERSGEPGREGLNILIRGSGTLNNNTPLVIIDGVERENIERLNPEDIESVSVLKDASAAIYGARAANGVIIVTTKTGKLGKPVFSISYNTAFQHPTQIPEMLDAVAYAQVYNEGDWYRQGRPATYIPFYSDEAIQKFQDGSDPVLYPNTDWMGEVLKPYSLEQRCIRVAPSVTCLPITNNITYVQKWM